MSSALKQAEAIADTLNPDEREQLKRYLSPQPESAKKRNDSPDAEKWAEFWRIGEELASQLKLGESPTKILTEARR